MTPAHECELFRHLANRGHSSGTLMYATGFSRRAIGRALDSLERDGMVVREKSPYPPHADVYRLVPVDEIPIEEDRPRRYIPDASHPIHWRAPA